MTLLSGILARRWGLPRAQTKAVVRERDLRVPMDDGAVLLADRWVAEETRGEAQPTVLVRSCYGRGGFFGLLHGHLLAERGLQVVIQSVRGTFGSEGSSIRSTSAPTGSRRCPGCAANRGTRDRSG